MTSIRTSYGDVTSEYHALRNSVGVVEHTHDLVWVEGPDAAAFLQGILSQDIEAMQVGDVARSLLLNPQGKLAAVLWVVRGDDTVGLFCDAGLSNVLEETLNYYRIRVKAVVRPDDRPVWSVIGPDAKRQMQIEGKWVERDGVLLTPAPLSGLERVLVTGAPDLDAVRVGRIATDTIRIESGEPVMNVDVDGGTIPQETGLVSTSVSFTKGCYLGQELVARIDSRGHVNRHLRGIVLNENVVPPLQAEVWAGEKAVGVLTSVGESLAMMAPVALSLIRREVDSGDTVDIRWPAGSATATVLELPMV